ncbi:MAG: hypothetical protein KatS3mg103_0971 [Phycisphaerales bacterium]|nr:MAG: hypothetical protein KatS3mg103_0971 [Phycisphaerales bacterium]
MLAFLSDRGGQNGVYDAYGVFLDRSLEGLTEYEAGRVLRAGPPRP